MTEKEYLRQLSAYHDILTNYGHWTSQSEAYMNLCREALRLAKQQGAVFDPEPVDLSPLKYSNAGSDRKLILLDNGRTGRLPTDEEAKEILKRCKAVDIIRRQALAITASGFNTLSIDYVLSVIDTGSEL